MRPNTQPAFGGSVLTVLRLSLVLTVFAVVVWQCFAQDPDPTTIVPPGAGFENYQCKDFTCNKKQCAIVINGEAEQNVICCTMGNSTFRACVGTKGKQCSISPTDQLFGTCTVCRTYSVLDCALVGNW